MPHDANAEGELLCLRSISSCFGRHQVLCDISLGVHSGEIICLLGHSGSGKTTLLRCINGLAAFQRGQIRFSGRAAKILLGSEDPGYRCLSEKEFAAYWTHIGMVVQRFNLFAHLSALNNVAVSRAKKRLYVIGDARAWGRLNHFGVLRERLPVMDAAQAAPEPTRAWMEPLS